MAANAAQQRRDVVGLDVAAREQARAAGAADHVVRAVDVLGRVERLADRDALAPALGVGADDAHEQDVALALRAERGPERRDERQADAPQLDRARSSSPAGRASRRA